MAKKNTVLDRKSIVQTDAEKVAVAAGKQIVSLLTKTDAAGIAEFVRKVNSLNAVLMQEGEGEGKRFSGATGHDFDSQAKALANIILRGNVPSWS